MSTTAQDILDYNRPSEGNDFEVLGGPAIGGCIGQINDFELGIFEYDFPDGSVLILRRNHLAVAFESR